MTFRPQSGSIRGTILCIVLSISQITFARAAEVHQRSCTDIGIAGGNIDEMYGDEIIWEIQTSTGIRKLMMVAAFVIATPVMAIHDPIVYGRKKSQLEFAFFLTAVRRYQAEIQACPNSPEQCEREIAAPESLKDMAKKLNRRIARENRKNRNQSRRRLIGDLEPIGTVELSRLLVEADDARTICSEERGINRPKLVRRRIMEDYRNSRAVSNEDTKVASPEESTVTARRAEASAPTSSWGY